MRRKAVWGLRPIGTALLLLALGISGAVDAAPRRAGRARAGVPGAPAKAYKLDRALARRAREANPVLTTRVIVTLMPGAQVPARFRRFARGGRLDVIAGQVLDLPNGLLKKLEAEPDIFRIHYDRPIQTTNFRTGVAVGARAVRNGLGYTGEGIGVAVVDSGITAWHDDLTSTSSRLYPYGNQRVAKFVDFVNGRPLPYDDNGHGTHVAGIAAGNGYDSGGEKAGIAPGASLVSLKVLDQDGAGTISSIIAALNWVAQHHAAYNIRVVNLSVGAGVYESYWTDPLTLAAKALTDRGITVVAAAGNMGRNAAGDLQYGAITAPGNAPWVLTVGASSTMGTLTRYDDTMAAYSSSGPTGIDYLAKPDLVAPGTGTVSLASPGSTFYETKSAYLLDGRPLLGSKPYLTLSGTSMAAPVVSGTVALMLQANPALTPNLIKAILQFTAQEYPGYSALRQGAGFLNTLGAVRLAKFFANTPAGARMPAQRVWGRKIIWGTHRIAGGVIRPAANAWGNGIVWGSAKTLGDEGDNIVWGTADAGDNIVWGTADSGDNVVWGTDCGGADCDNVVWGTTDEGDNIVWGTADEGDNIVWGTADEGDNIVWGTGTDEDVTWGSSSGDQIVYPDDVDLAPGPSVDDEFGEPASPVGEDAAVTDPIEGF
ncbi:MAG: S8 family peptidase [Acidobacteria bacterium]|nr:S8 family peptidase [Acidobacteriota bacterium]